jgi:hypothetical protein
MLPSPAHVAYRFATFQDRINKAIPMRVDALPRRNLLTLGANVQTMENSSTAHGTQRGPQVCAQALKMEADSSGQTGLLPLYTD